MALGGGLDPKFFPFLLLFNYFFINAGCRSIKGLHDALTMWLAVGRTLLLSELGVRSLTLGAPVGQSEKRAWLPYSATILPLAQGGQLGFLKSKAIATADLVSSSQYVDSNEFYLFCVHAFVWVWMCKCVHRGVGQSGEQGKPKAFSREISQ